MTYSVILLNSYDFISIQNIEKNDIKKREFQSIVNIISRFNKALKFFEKNSLNVNLDGLFGLRIAQG